MQDTDEYGKTPRPRAALVTGGSRGIGAETAVALAGLGYDVFITYHNKATRAQEVVARIRATGHRADATAADITAPDEPARLMRAVSAWAGGALDLLVLNASGGLERERVGADPLYPERINRDAQLALLDRALPLLAAGGVVALVTSHWAHLYGRATQIPAYEPIAASKHAGEVALRARQDDLAARGIRLVVVTADVIEGTITPRLLERATPGLEQQRSEAAAPLPTAADVGEAIAAAATDDTLPSGHTVVIGSPLDALADG